MKKQDNKMPEKEHNTALISDCKETETNEMLDGEYKRMIMILKKIHENTERQLNGLENQCMIQLSRDRYLKKEANRNLENEELNKPDKKYS